MPDPRPAVALVYVLTQTGVHQAGLIDAAHACGRSRRGIRAQVRLFGAPRPTIIHPDLIFEAEATARALRARAVALGRTARWRHRSMDEIALHLIEKDRSQ